jgi:hypothetical protein
LHDDTAKVAAMSRAAPTKFWFFIGFLLIVLFKKNGLD